MVELSGLSHENKIFVIFKMSFITQTHDVLQEIQVNGTYKGRTAYAFSILGKRDDTFSEAKGPLYDIGEYLGSSDEIFSDPSAGVTMIIKSSSANDTNSSGEIKASVIPDVITSAPAVTASIQAVIIANS